MTSPAFRKFLWNHLEQIIAEQVDEWGIQPFRNKDPNPRNQDFSLFLEGDLMTVEVALYHDRIQISGSSEMSAETCIEYDDEMLIQKLQSGLVAFGINVDLSELV